MKANEAPEKIILSADRDTQIINDEWVINDYTNNIKIEYVRTDTFLEKACAWLEEKCDLANYEAFNPDNRTYYIDHDKMIDDFKKYMKGE